MTLTLKLRLWALKIKRLRKGSKRRNLHRNQFPWGRVGVLSEHVLEELLLLGREKTTLLVVLLDGIVVVQFGTTLMLEPVLNFSHWLAELGCKVLVFGLLGIGILRKRRIRKRTKTEKRKKIKIFWVFPGNYRKNCKFRQKNRVPFLLGFYFTRKGKIRKNSKKKWVWNEFSGQKLEIRCDNSRITKMSKNFRERCMRILDFFNCKEKGRSGIKI